MSTTAGSRLEIRLDRDLKDEVEAAAAIQGLSVSAFVVATVLEAARKVRRDHQTTVMDDEERDAFLALLQNPPPPSEGLVALMATEVVL